MLPRVVQSLGELPRSRRRAADGRLHGGTRLARPVLLDAAHPLVQAPDGRLRHGASSSAPRDSRRARDVGHPGLGPLDPLAGALGVLGLAQAGEGDDPDALGRAPVR